MNVDFVLKLIGSYLAKHPELIEKVVAAVIEQITSHIQATTPPVSNPAS